jgi:hypothetical protein
MSTFITSVVVLLRPQRKGWRPTAARREPGLPEEAGWIVSIVVSLVARLVVLGSPLAE